MADSKVTALTELTTPQPTDELMIIDNSGAPVSKRVSRKNNAGYTEYVALITQAGVAAPTAVEIKNDTGATVAYAYLGQGAYSMTFSSAVLTANKTIAILGETVASHKGAVVTNTTLILLSVSNPAGVNANDLLSKTPVIIRIYV